MKKLITIMLSLFLAVGGMFTPLQADAASSDLQAGIVSTAGGNLNVRSNASAGSTVVATMGKGSYVTLLSKSGSWWRVEYAGGKYGYCHSDYITTVSSTAASVRTQGGNLNIRSGAGVGHSIVGSLANGSSVVVLSSSSGWSRILYHGTKTGYVSSQYLTTSSGYSAVTLNVPDYKQSDSRWANVKLGTSGKTIAQIGCATTAVAMMESYRTGSMIYPDVMSKKLSYSSDGNLYWPSDYVAVTASSEYLNSIYQQLKRGKPVLFGAKNSSGGQHWVVITGYMGGSSLTTSGFIINDPGSSTRTTLQQLLQAYPSFYKYFYYN